MKTNQRKSGFVLSSAQMIISTLIGLLFTPYLIRTIGDIEYGLYQLMLSTVGYLAILDMGMTSTVTQFILKGQSTEEKDLSEASVIKVSLLFYSIISSIIVIVFGILSIYLKEIYPASINSNNIDYARKIFIILGCNLVLTLMSHTFTGIHTAYEKYKFVKGLDIAKHILKVSILLILFNWKKDAELIVMVDLLLAVIYLCCDIIYYKIKIKIDLRSGKMNRVVIRRITTFSVFVLFQLIVNKVNNGVDQFLLGRYISLQMVGMYSVALVYTSMFQSIGGLLPGVSIPRFTRLVTDRIEKRQVTAICAQYGRYQYMILMLFVSGFILFGRQFFGCWTKAYDNTYLWGVTLLITLPQIVEFIETPIFYVMKAEEKQAGRSIILVIMAVINIVLSVILLKHFPVYGCAIGTCISFTLGNCILTNIYYHKVLHINILQFYRILFKRLLPTTIGLLGVGLLINCLPGNGWINLIIKCTLFGAIYVLCIILLGTNDSEKQTIFSMIHLQNQEK